MNDIDQVYELLHCSQDELVGDDAVLVKKMRECYAFLRSIGYSKACRMLFLTDTTKEERLFWSAVSDIDQYNRSWEEELQERRKLGLPEE